VTHELMAAVAHYIVRWAIATILLVTEAVMNIHSWAHQKGNILTSNAREVSNFFETIEFDQMRPVPWLRTLGDILINGPKAALLLLNNSKKERERYFEQIFRFSLTFPDTIHSTWLVFKREREFFEVSPEEAVLPQVPGVIVCRIHWDLANDLQKARAKEFLVSDSPKVAFSLFYVSDDSRPLSNAINALDNIVSKGIKITKRGNKQAEWSEISFSRLQNNCGITQFWSSELRSMRCEAVLFEIREVIDGLIQTQERKDLVEVERVRLLYGDDALLAKDVLRNSQK